MNCESHNEATISGHIKNSKPIITIDDLKKESPKKSNAIDNQNNDNLSLNQHAGVRKDSDSVKLDKTNPTSTNTKAINPSLDDKKKDSNLYKASKFQIIRNKSKTPSVLPPSKFIDSSSKSNFQLFSPIKKVSKEQSKSKEKNREKAGSKIKIINTKANLSVNKSRNIHVGLSNNKTNSPGRKVFNTENGEIKITKPSHANINKTSNFNSNKSKIIRFTKRRQDNKKLSRAESIKNGLKSSSVNELRNIKQLNSKFDSEAINQKSNILKSHKLPTFPNKLTNNEDDSANSKKMKGRQQTTLDDRIISEIERKLTLMDKLISE